MKFLLDTNIWIWALICPDKLGRTVRRQLVNPRNEFYLSPVSVWETYHLQRRGKVRLKQSLSESHSTIFSRTPLREAPLNFAVGLEASRIQLPQSDVGDVFLAATACVFDLTLVTSDSQLLACSWLKTLANG